MGAVAPVAQINAELFRSMATTFEAIDRDPNALAGDDREVAVDAGGRRPESLNVQQPFLVDLTTFGEPMTPATASLDEALPRSSPRSRPVPRL